ncbi:hypothetical protein EVAR_26435_1 [Eumeta japonica]|uniref:EGF-like domain-containing protein n=1 Tax=Eumeta variegata TaxID=151549 RepID=A0A4C1VQ30_EUMVA|nr:hypothetical protein EVAR_26435_1 [Eumeta japonica]
MSTAAEYRYSCLGSVVNKEPLSFRRVRPSVCLPACAQFSEDTLNIRKPSRAGTNTSDACERSDPCQHGGVCISTDAGPVCECRGGDYEGAFCERGKPVEMKKNGKG